MSIRPKRNLFVALTLIERALKLRNYIIWSVYIVLGTAYWPRNYMINLTDHIYFVR